MNKNKPARYLDNMDSIVALDDNLTKEIISIPTIKSQHEVGYPSEWLLANPGKKPPLQIWKAKTANEAYHAAFGTNVVWNDVAVCTFIVKTVADMECVSVVADEDWIADERTIVKKGDTCTPLDLLDIQESDLTFEARGTGGTPAYRQGFVFALLSNCRKAAAKENREQYGITISGRLDTFMTTANLGITTDALDTARQFATNSCMTPGYLKLVAAFDMFWMRFPKAASAPLRILTLVSRYKGCAAFTSMTMISQLVGLSASELAMFVMTRSVAQDYVRIAKDAKYAKETYGYFPYQSDMGLVSRSAYSIAANPTLYIWLHCIGTVAGSTRSMNATEPQLLLDLPNTVNSALAAATVLLGGGGYMFQFVRPGDKQVFKKFSGDFTREAERRARDTGRPPQSLDETTEAEYAETTSQADTQAPSLDEPDGGYIALPSSADKITMQIVETFKQLQMGLDNSAYYKMAVLKKLEAQPIRDGSIAHLLKKHLTGYQPPL